VLHGKPGSMHWHNQDGFEVAGLALENVDQEPFAEAVKHRVLGPLAMGGGFDSATIKASDHSLGHYDPGYISYVGGGPPGGGPPPVVEIDADCRNRDPATGYHGSIRDVAKLATYLTGGAGQILAPATLDAMLSKQAPHFFTNRYASHGAEGLTSLNRDVVISGSIAAGFNAQIGVFKQDRLAVVTLMNSSQGKTWALVDAIARIYLDIDWRQKPYLGYTPAPESLPSLVGMYRDDLGFNGSGGRTLEVSLDPAKPGVLIGTLWGADGGVKVMPFFGLYCADNFTFPIEAAQPTVRFWRDAAGSGHAISLDVDGADSGPPFYRVP